MLMFPRYVDLWHERCLQQELCSRGRRLRKDLRRHDKRRLTDAKVRHQGRILHERRFANVLDEGYKQLRDVQAERERVHFRCGPLVARLRSQRRALLRVYAAEGPRYPGCEVWKWYVLMIPSTKQRFNTYGIRILRCAVCSRFEICWRRSQC
jgi:hypothetical protein